MNGAITLLPPHAFIAWVGTILSFTIYFLCLLSDFDETVYKIPSFNGAKKSALFSWPQKDLHLTITMKSFSIFGVKSSSVQFCMTSYSAPFCNLLLFNRRQESSCWCHSMRRVSRAVSYETVELHAVAYRGWGRGVRVLNPPPPRNSEGPPKSCQIQLDYENC